MTARKVEGYANVKWVRVDGEKYVKATHLLTFLLDQAERLPAYEADVVTAIAQNLSVVLDA